MLKKWPIAAVSELVDLVELGDMRLARVAGRDAEDLVVAAGLFVGHLKTPDRAGG